METLTSDDVLLRASITAHLNALDLSGLLEDGAPANEYDLETNDFFRLMIEGLPITPDVVATVWHKWFGDPDSEPAPPTAGMAELAADLHALQ